MELDQLTRPLAPWNLREFRLHWFFPGHLRRMSRHGVGDSRSFLFPRHLDRIGLNDNFRNHINANEYGSRSIIMLEFLRATDSGIQCSTERTHTFTWHVFTDSYRIDFSLTFSIHNPKRLYQNLSEHSGGRFCDTIHLSEELIIFGHHSIRDLLYRLIRILWYLFGCVLSDKIRPVPLVSHFRELFLLNRAYRGYFYHGLLSRVLSFRHYFGIMV